MLAVEWTSSLVSAALLLGACLCGLLWWLGLSLSRQAEQGRLVADPFGRKWRTQIHWGKPGVHLGVARRMFPGEKSVTDDTEDGRAATNGTVIVRAQAEPPKRRWFDYLAELVPDELVYVIIIVVALLVGLLLIAELALFILIAGPLLIARGLFGHPWTIEVDDPDGGKAHRRVKGLGNARTATAAIRQEVKAGSVVTADEAVADVPPWRSQLGRLRQMDRTRNEALLMAGLCAMGVLWMEVVN